MTRTPSNLEEPVLRVRERGVYYVSASCCLLIRVCLVSDSKVTVYTHTLTLTRTCCYDVLNEIQDLKMYSHAESLILALTLSLSVCRSLALLVSVPSLLLLLCTRHTLPRCASLDEVWAPAGVCVHCESFVLITDDRVKSVDPNDGKRQLYFHRDCYNRFNEAQQDKLVGCPTPEFEASTELVRASPFMPYTEPTSEQGGAMPAMRLRPEQKAERDQKATWNELTGVIPDPGTPRAKTPRDLTPRAKTPTETGTPRAKTPRDLTPRIETPRAKTPPQHRPTPFPLHFVNPGARASPTNVPPIQLRLDSSRKYNQI